MMFTDGHFCVVDGMADDPDDYDEDEDEDEEDDDEDEEDEDENGGEKWYVRRALVDRSLSHKLHILLDFRPASFLH